MGRESTQQTTPEVRETSAASIKSGSDKAARVPSASQRHVLPENLDHAVKQLTDDELMQLVEVVLQEAEQRGKSPLSTNGASIRSRQTDDVMPVIVKTTSRKRALLDEGTLSPGKLNAVRAAFKAGVTPSRIARQFGISQANVRKALASDDRKQ